MPSEVLFGTRLRTEREARGITLDTIAKQTKVARSLLADMERGRFDRWPPGIFGRAFIKGYAEAIGLDAGTVVAEFVDIFPDARPSSLGERESPAVVGESLELPGARSRPAAVSAGTDDLRLVLVDDDGADRVGWPRGAATWAGSVVDVGFVFVPATVAAVVTTGVAPWMAAGLAGLGALVVVTTRLGGSPGLWLLRRRRSVPEPIAVFEDPIEDLFITPISQIDERPEALVVSPEFYRPSPVRRYGHRARHA